jgi:predicted Zn-dependent protease
MKKCAMCGESEPRVKFGKNKNSKDGKQSYCLECYKKKRDQYNKTDHAKQLAKIRKDKYKKEGKLKAYNKKYYERNKQFILAKKRTESVVTVTSVPRVEKIMNPRRKSIIKPSEQKKKKGTIILDPKPVN